MKKVNGVLLVALGLLFAALLFAYAGSGTNANAFQASETPTLTPTDTPTPPPSPTSLPSPTPTEPAPTLVPPTPLPTVTPIPADEVAVSGLAYAQQHRVLRVGTLYNAYPFTWLNEYGEVDGYEAEIMNAIGIELGVEIEYVQVTRHNADATLIGGQIDLLIGQQAHTRDREDMFDFTHPYYVNHERMVVLTDAPYASLGDLAGQPVSVEIGSRSERALRHWLSQSGVRYDVRTYLTESEALDALASGEVQGMVGELDNLSRAGRQGMRLIDEPVLQEPYSIVVRRWDVNLRNLLNRSLQRLKASGRLDEIFKVWFPYEAIDFTTLVPVYELLYEDARTLDDFNADVPYPAQTVMERLANGQPLRVAGLTTFEESVPAQARILDALNRALVEEMARRWGVQIEIIPNSALNPVDLVANGLADLAVGVTPYWDGADRVEYSLPYVRHANRLMVPANKQINGFGDMLGTGWWIGYFADDPGDAELIKIFAERAGVAQNIRDPFAIQNEDRAITAMVEENNISAVFGDSLRLLALIRESSLASQVRLLDTIYGDVLPITFAGPRNDADFRAQLDFTLQDMVRDGVYQQFWATHFGLGDPLPIPVWGPISPDAP